MLSLQDLKAPEDLDIEDNEDLIDPIGDVLPKGKLEFIMNRTSSQYTNNNPFADSLLIQRTPTTSTPASTRPTHSLSSENTEEPESTTIASPLDKKLESLRTKTTPQNLLRVLSRLPSPLCEQSPSPLTLRLTRSQSTPAMPRSCRGSLVDDIVEENSVVGFKMDGIEMKDGEDVNEQSELFRMIHSRLSTLVNTTPSASELTTLAHSMHTLLTDTLQETKTKLLEIESTNQELVATVRGLVGIDHGDSYYSDSESDTESIDMNNSAHDLLDANDVISEEDVVANAQKAFEAIVDKSEEIHVKGEKIGGMMYAGEVKAGLIESELCELEEKLGNQFVDEDSGEWWTPVMFVMVVCMTVFLITNPAFVEGYE